MSTGEIALCVCVVLSGLISGWIGGRTRHPRFNLMPGNTYYIAYMAALTSFGPFANTEDGRQALRDIALETTIKLHNLQPVQEDEK